MTSVNVQEKIAAENTARRLAILSGHGNAISKDIDPTGLLTENPLQSSMGWRVTSNMYDTTDPDLTPPFSWVQVYFTSAFTGIPQLVIQGVEGQCDSIVAFAYSGERFYFKGTKILSEGTDRFGNSITSTLIGEDTATQLTAVYAYGGTR